jgi:hypothetical protein
MIYAQSDSCQGTNPSADMRMLRSPFSSPDSLRRCSQKQFVTVNQVDRARTLEVAQAEALKQAQSQLLLSQAGLKSTLAQYECSKAVLQESHAQHEQSIHAVTKLELLINQRGARASAVETARYNLNNCWRLCTIRYACDQPYDLGGRLRACGAASVHADRCAHLVGNRQLSRRYAAAYRARHAGRRFSAVRTEYSPFGRSGQYRLRYNSRS